MRAKVAERQAARRLRLAGWPIRRIAAELGVSLSSVSVWVRDVPRPTLEPPNETREPPSGITKRCGRCRETLPIERFNRSGRHRQHWCRLCYVEYFRVRGDVHRRQSAAARQRRRARAQTFVAEYLSKRLCVDCGTADPVVLEFDHLGDKRGNVSHLVLEGYSLAALSREIDACEVVCVNCHRKRTARRANWRRADPNWRSRTTPGLTPSEASNLAYVYELLDQSRCVDCGEGDMAVLDFDHLGTKSGAVVWMARSGYGRRRLELEIGRCVIRCGNCHRRRTAQALDHYRARSA